MRRWSTSRTALGAGGATAYFRRRGLNTPSIDVLSTYSENATLVMRSSAGTKTLRFTETLLTRRADYFSGKTESSSRQSFCAEGLLASQPGKVFRVSGTCAGHQHGSEQP